MNSWLYLSATGFACGDDTDTHQAAVCFWHAESSLCYAPLKEACAALHGQAVKLILPMELCSYLLTDAWPGRRPSVQALAFAVEEQLANDPEDLHFAVGRQDAQQRYPLLIIGKQRLEQLLSLLKAQGLTVVSVHVDADLLPDDYPCGLGWDGRWLIGGAQDVRLALSDDDLKVLGPALPADMVWGGTEVEHCFSVTPTRSINLLQGSFKPVSRRWPWRGLGVAGGLVCALALGFTHARSGSLETRAAQLYAQSEARFKALYPSQERIVDLPAQFRALQQRGREPQGGHLARLLQLAERVIGASSVEVQRMEWRAAAGWTLSVSAGSFAELERVRERGVQQALPITVANASQQGRRVNALLTLGDTP